MDTRKFSLITLLLLCLTSSLLIPLAAQDEIILTVGVQEWMMDNFTGRVFEQFQADHPGVKVVVVPLGEFSVVAAASKSLKGILNAPVPVFWNIEKTGN